MTNSKRIGWIDVAKGLCMLSVMAGHLSSTPINRVVFAYHLTVFFLLSGYTLKVDLSAEGLGKRFRSLMTPYFITCACITAMDVVNLVVLDGVTGIWPITASIAKNLLRSFMASGTRTNFGALELGSMIGAIWFLPAMFFATVTAQLLLQHIPSRKNRYLVGGGLAVLSHISAQFLWLPFSIQAGVFVAPFLLIGYDMRQFGYPEKLRLRHFFLCLAVFLLGMGAGLTKIYFVTTTVSDLFLSALVTLAASGCILYLSRKLERCPFLGWVGKNSLLFLCIHSFDMAVMGRWFKGGFALLGLGYPIYVKFLIRLIFACAVTALLLLWKKRPKKAIPSLSHRDEGLDIAKGLLIVLMLVGHFTIAPVLRKIIYSFHMAAFVFYSGYCFRSGRPLGQTVLRLIRAFLIPYAIFGLFYIWLMDLGTGQEVKNLLFGMSFVHRGFSGIDSIGPVYFILLLFLTRLVYALLDQWISHRGYLAAAVVGLSLLGVVWGRLGIWLPWSIDCALYCLIFYYLGALCREQGIVNALIRRGWPYFLLSTLWVYMIFKGSMEIAVRNYGNYSIVVLGAVSGCILLYWLCRYLSTALPRSLCRLLCLLGENTLYILMVHRLLNSRCNRLWSRWLTPGHLWHTAATICTQLLMGLLIGTVIASLKRIKKHP